MSHEHRLHLIDFEEISAKNGCFSNFEYEKNLWYHCVALCELFRMFFFIFFGIDFFAVSDLFAFGSKANKSVTQTTLVVQIWLRGLYVSRHR